MLVWGVQMTLEGEMIRLGADAVNKVGDTFHPPFGWLCLSAAPVCGTWDFLGNRGDPA